MKIQLLNKLNKSNQIKSNQIKENVDMKVQTGKHRGPFQMPQRVLWWLPQLAKNKFAF